MEVVQPEQVSYTYRLRLARNFGLAFVSRTIQMGNNIRKYTMSELQIKGSKGYLSTDFFFFF